MFRFSWLGIPLIKSANLTGELSAFVYCFWFYLKLKFQIVIFSNVFNFYLWDKIFLSGTGSIYGCIMLSSSKHFCCGWWWSHSRFTVTKFEVEIKVYWVYTCEVPGGQCIHEWISEPVHGNFVMKFDGRVKWNRERNHPFWASQVHMPKVNLCYQWAQVRCKINEDCESVGDHKLWPISETQL